MEPPRVEDILEERDRLRWVVQGAHGALADSGSVVVPGVLDGDLAPAIRQLIRERDEARADMSVLDQAATDYRRARDKAEAEVERLRGAGMGHTLPDQRCSAIEHKALRAEVERLTRERDVARVHLRVALEGSILRDADCDATLLALRTERDDARAEVARLTRERDEAERLRAHEYAIVDQVGAKLAEAKASLRALAEAGENVMELLEEDHPARVRWDEAKRKAGL